jgi:hypothetical protein
MGYDTLFLHDLPLWDGDLPLSIRRLLHGNTCLFWKATSGRSGIPWVSAGGNGPSNLPELNGLSLMAHVTVRTVVVAESRVLLQGVSGTCEVEFSIKSSVGG